MANKIKAREHRLGEEFSTRALEKWTAEDLAAKLVELGEDAVSSRGSRDLIDRLQRTMDCEIQRKERREKRAIAQQRLITEAIGGNIDVLCKVDINELQNELNKRNLNTEFIKKEDLVLRLTQALIAD